MTVATILKRGRPKSRPLLFAGMLLAWALSAPLASDVSVTVEHRGGEYAVRGRFRTTADSGVVWRVLSDYPRIPSFVTSMKESSVDEQKGPRLKVRQLAVIGVFPLRRKAHLLLDVLERRPERIEFRDILAEDFRFYRGAWDIVGDSTGTLVAYSLDAAAKTAAPSWMARGVMRRGAQQLLEQVRDEIERRAAAPAR